MNALRIALCSLLVLIATAPLMAQGTYTKIDFPGSLYTVALGVNINGDVVGEYEDVNNNFQGFLLRAGVFTNISYPGATSTCTLGINDVNQIVGKTDTTGFMYDLSSDTFTPLAYPNMHDFTYPYHINNVGTIVGEIIIVNQHTSYPVGFEFSNGSYQEVLPNGFAFSVLRGINNLGVAIGNADSRDFSSQINFLFENNTFQQVGIRGDQLAASGINDVNAIVGSFRAPNGHTAGFLYDAGVFQTLAPRGAIFAFASDINNFGEVVGYYTDSSDKVHGFTWTPSADAATK